MHNLEGLMARSAGACELCGSANKLRVYEVLPEPKSKVDNAVLLCDICLAQVEKRAELDNNHWKCLSTSMWSETPAVQVLAWRMLNRVRNESWAMENLDMMFLEDDMLTWAKASGDHENTDSVELHKDANGQILQNGDTVILTKSLDVKGSTLNAKMGTVVKNIRIVTDNTEQIEGKIEGQLIVILTKFVRKQSEK